MALAQQGHKKQTIALCMIVKDEEEVILRALRSVENVVDYYCICDTGSTDKTVEVIQKYLKEKGFDGEIQSRPWVSFPHNRQEAFDLAKGKCDYIMTLDADEVLAPIVDDKPSVYHKITNLPTFTTDRILLPTISGSCKYDRAQFYKESVNWKWVSPVHEVCIPVDTEITQERIDSFCVIPNTDGARAKDPNRFLYDAFILEKGLIETPEDWRMWFYLGQSYHDCGRPESAIEPFKKCAENTSWLEEKGVAFLRVARIYHRLEGFEVALPWYWKSWEANPHRGEALYEIIKHYREHNMFNVGAAIGDLFLECDYNKSEMLFIEQGVYEWQAKDDISVCYFYVGRRDESQKLVEEILEVPHIPHDCRERITKNKGFFK